MLVREAPDASRAVQRGVSTCCATGIGVFINAGETMIETGYLDSETEIVTANALHGATLQSLQLIAPLLREYLPWQYRVTCHLLARPMARPGFPSEAAIVLSGGAGA